MAIWSLARQQGRAAHQSTLSSSTDESSAIEEMALDYIKRKFKEYSIESTKCFFCTVHATVTGYLPGFGAIKRCKGCAEKYNDYKRIAEHATKTN
jgi:hypothetical protein